MIKVHGVSLHFYDEANNNDKFYRAFVWSNPSGHWHAAFHWGRDGSAGQSGVVHYDTEAQVIQAMDRKLNEKLGKGYQFLGQGDIEIDGYDALDDTRKVGDLLHARVGRDPVKLPSGFQLVIREEEDFEDLLLSS